MDLVWREASQGLQSAPAVVCVDEVGEMDTTIE